MNLRTKLDWQGYRLAGQNEETMGCSTEQTDMCTSIQNYRDRAHEMQELFRKTAETLRKLYPHVETGMIQQALDMLADYSPDADGEFEHVTTDGSNVTTPICEKEARNLLRAQYGHENFVHGIRIRGQTASVEGGMLRLALSNK